MGGADAGPVRTHLRGVLVDVAGVGILLQGPSGTGKRERTPVSALRRRRLMADDPVVVRRKSPRTRIGPGPPLPLPAVSEEDTE